MMKRSIRNILWLATVVVFVGHFSGAYGLDRKRKCVKFADVDHYVQTCDRGCVGYCEAVVYHRGECRRGSITSSCRQWHDVVQGKVYAGDCFPSYGAGCKCGFSESDFIRYDIAYPTTKCR